MVEQSNSGTMMEEHQWSSDGGTVDNDGATVHL